MVAATDSQKILEEAAKKLDARIDAALGRDVSVSVSRGATVRNWRPDASEDVVEILVKDEKFKNADAAFIDEQANKILAELKKDTAIRRNSILVSPKQYLDDCKTEVGELQKIAKELGIPMGDVDFTKASVLDHDLANNQKPKYGTQVISSPDVTTIRINVPTDPQNLEKAEEEAKRIVAEFDKHKAESHKGAIEYIKRKDGGKQLSPEQEKHYQDHEFEAKMQQQGNWTSVFINIRSPEQKRKKEHPEEKILKADGKEMTPEELQNTNMLMQIENADRRAKLGGRLALFNGEKLNQPAAYFMEVAGTEDIKTYLAKMLHFVVSKKPELKGRAEDLLAENFLVSNEDWNLPAEKQSLRKQPVSASVKPGTDEMKITIKTRLGKADAMLGSIAGIAPEAAVSPTPEAKPVAAPAIDAAAAAAAAACAPNEIAVAGAVGAAADGVAGAAAGAACVEKPPVTIGSHTYEPKPVSKMVTPEMAASFLKSKAEQATARKEETLYTGKA